MTLDDLKLLSERLATDAAALNDVNGRLNAGVDSLLALVSSPPPVLNDADQAKVDAAGETLTQVAETIEAVVADLEATVAKAAAGLPGNAA